MPSIHRQLVFLATIAGLIVAAGTRARGQDDTEADERARDAGVEEILRLRALQQGQRLRAAYRSQLDRWLASQFGTRAGVGEQLEMRLTRKLREIASECHLTDAQTDKLRLAGRGDIKRLLDRIHEIARTINSPDSSVDDLRNAIGELRSMDTPVSEWVFGESSLLCKTLAGSMDPDQAARRQQALFDRSRLRYRLALTSAVNTLRVNLGLSDEQCARLSDLLTRHTRPPRVFGRAPDIALVLYQASRIPEAKVRPIFDAGQWRIVSQWMSVYVKGATGEKTLKEHGFVFDDDQSPDALIQVRP